MKNTKKRAGFIALMITAMIMFGSCNSSDHNSDRSDSDSGYSDRSGSNSNFDSDFDSDFDYDYDYDSALLGRWRGEDGSYFELWADGSFQTNLAEDIEYFKSAKEKNSEEIWICSDGQLTFAWEHDVACEYDYQDKGTGEWNVLTIVGNGFTFLDIGDGRQEYRKRSEGMVGQWDDGSLGYFIFEEDGTGTYAYTEGSSILELKRIEIPIQWDFDDQYLYIYYINALSYDYYITSEDTLTLYGENGSLEYKKITSHS